MTALVVCGVLLAIVAVKIVLISVFFGDEIRAALDRDPAATNPFIVVLTYPGLHALVYHRMANTLYRIRVPFIPRLISQIGRSLTGIEIHPGVRIGRGFFIDHGMGVVIGETAIIGDNVTIYQGVTLGGTGKERGKRHPTIGNNVVIGAGAKVLGNIRIGDNSFVGANAVVIRDVPTASTVVGVPGRVASREGRRLPATQLDHMHLPDPLSKAIQRLQSEIGHLEHELRQYRQSSKERKPEERRPEGGAP